MLSERQLLGEAGQTMVSTVVRVPQATLKILKEKKNYSRFIREAIHEKIDRERQGMERDYFPWREVDMEEDALG